MEILQRKTLKKCHHPLAKPWVSCVSPTVNNHSTITTIFWSLPCLSLCSRCTLPFLAIFMKASFVHALIDLRWLGVLTPVLPSLSACVTCCYQSIKLFQLQLYWLKKAHPFIWFWKPRSRSLSILLLPASKPILPPLFLHSWSFQSL